MTKTSIPQKWFSGKRAINEMKGYTEKGFKQWEKAVVTKNFPLKADILDIGCGMGREAFLLYDLGFSPLGIDISEEVIIEAKKRAEISNRKVEFLCTDGKVLPFNNASFDVVIIWSQTMGLLYGDESQKLFLKECKRVLKDKGIISFSGHDQQYIMQNHINCIVDGKFYPFENSDIYWEMFTIDGLAKMAKSAGFHVLECGKGQLYRPEDGTILNCVAKK